MRHCYRVLMLGMAILLSSVCTGFSAKAAIDNTAYGVLAFSADQYRLANNVVTFDLLSDSEPVFTKAVGFAETSTAGAYGGNFYYIATSQEGADGEVPKSLVRVDLTNGNYATVGPLTGFDYLINDMTYDWSTSKMYCVSRVDNTISALYTIDLSTAQAKRVANLDRRFFTLAASYAGQLYGISFAGEFCSIDKATGAVTVIGHTGHYPQNFQCMEFDHAERTLYWVASTRKFNESGTIEVPESFMATIDLNTGEANRLQNFGDNQLVGLYIPSFAAADNCPAPVTSPAVAAAPQGASSATISWVNPSTTFGGEPLKAITKVEITRDGNVVGTVTNAEPGAASSYVDNINDASGKVYDWRITAYNANGAGASVAISAFVGKDEPAAVTGLNVEKLTPNSARVTWNAVTAGKNGGWTDPETMKYDVVRQPGNVKVAEGIEATVWDEPGVEESGTYFYEVTAINSCGTSAVAVSPSITLGPKLGIPYVCTFTDDFGQWTPIDANEDDNTWIRNAISWAKADGAYFMSANNAGDDWLVSNTIEFEPNSAYKIKLYCFAYGNHPLDFYLLKDGDRENPLQMINTLELTRAFELSWKEFQFATGAEIGDCNLAIHNRAEKGNSYMIIDRIEIEKLADKNITATALRGVDKPIEGNTYTYTVSLTNKGASAYDSYEVTLIDQDGNAIASVQVTEAIEPGASKDVLVEYTYPKAANITSLRGKVIAAGDEIAADDVTPALDITLLPVGSPEEVNIGTKVSTSSNNPLNLYYKYGASLNIYDATEIGVKRGRITGIKLAGNLGSYYTAPKNISVKVYLANTDRTLASEGWIPEEEMTMVYNDTIDIVNGDNVLDLEFNRAFDYEGGNLAMLTVTSLDKSNVSYTYLYQPYYNSPISGNKAIVYNGNYDEFNFSNTSNTASGNGVITLMVQSGGASITGVVTNSDGEPIEGAEVEINELNAFATTAADGSYRFDFVPNDTYTLSVAMFGYSADGTQTVTIEDADAKADFVLTKIPTYSVWGTVKDAAGTLLADAVVLLTGYADLSTVTDVDGKFTFNDVVAYAETTVNVAMPWYVGASRQFNLADNTNLGEITLDYAHYAPANLSVDASDGDMAILNWTDPAAVSELRYDSGVANSQIGLSVEVGTAVIGTVFRTPMTLGSVSWYTTSEGGPHHSVNLYIYDLDEEGNPTGTLLYSERAVRNIDDQWIEYVLPASVEAPRGCFVSINYPGFHAIGLDDNLREYPMPERAYAFSVDFASGEFMYFNPEDLGGNLMIRAYGRAYSAEGLANLGDSAPEFVKYNVWRSVGYGSDEWTAINNEPVAFTSLADASWSSLPAGVYRYAVSTVYPDNVESAKVVAPYIPHLMYGSVKMNVKTNSHSGSAAGAAVMLASSDLTESHAAIVGADGSVEFDGVWRSQYSLDIELPGYEFDSQDVDMLASEVTDLGEVVLKEIIAQPVNVVVSGSADEGYLLTWNESGEIFDGFEDHTPFAQASAGEVGWLYRDGDGARTFAEPDFDFPGRTQPGSFMVFNPWLTTPSMAELRSASLPRTGQAELACFAGFTGSDDWFISPRLTYHGDFTFRFYARGYSQTYGEVIRVGYSTTGLEPEAFVWLADNVDVPKQEWTEYEYTVPADARYVAVNCISPDGFTLFIDDVEITSGNGLPMNTAVTGPEVKYEVWLDGTKVADTDQCSYTFAGIPEDVHIAQVKAVYASGESEPATVQFGTSGIGIVDNDGLSIYPNPASDYVNVKGAFSHALIYDLSGVLVKTFDGSDSRLDLSNISSGYYILLVESATGQRLTFKLTVKK